MSLVAYAASSDEESDNDEESTPTQVQLIKPTAATQNGGPPVKATEPNGHISDDDDDYIPQEVSLQELKATSTGRLLLSLPKPKVAAEPNPQEQKEDDQVAQAFAKLPMPRTSKKVAAIIEEVDDEFLHKKAIPTAGSGTLEKPPPAAARGRVKISIPSLSEYADVDKELAEKLKTKQPQLKSTKGCGLLSILPQAKSERDFARKPEPVSVKPTNKNDPTPQPSKNALKINTSPAFVPDTVKQRRTAHNTEGVDGIKAPSAKPSKPSKPTASLVSVSDSEDEEEVANAGDFFSLNSEQQLPEVSSNEISALVAKRAAKMMEASNKYLTEVEERKVDEEEVMQVESEQLQHAQKRYHQQLNTEAMDALVGKNAKRRRKEVKEMQVIDIVGDQVMPDREEWMRTALASATTFQPTGVLTDEEPVAGTRRKHQITYLAHKAKANEAELQAMWSANRQTRRATQSKYGF
ncbi:proline-rich protein PRCC [Drosophila hydei]|uniref:Proline-rich protein PRCC n=1 Tax=Drosophila hydei TaxID=7224 RepID=A0A6J1LJC2_DROHY|nr:proline-rich protein PRCC [Drosophila hydei]